MKAYNGFDKDLKCRGFQYKLGREYQETEASLCREGVHACENPLDTFRYYPPTDSRYCEVEIADNGQRNSDDSKVCGEKIKIGAEIGLDGVIKAGAQFIFEMCKGSSEDHASGEGGNAAASGDRGNAAASGERGNAAASGDSGNAAASGDSGNAAASGNRCNAAASGWRGNAAASGWRGNAAASGERGNAAASGEGGNAAASGWRGNAAASGDRGNAAASGWSGNAAASGNRGNAAASGDSGNAAASGWRGTATVTGQYGGAKALGNDCLATAWGPESKAMGKAGNWLVLSEHKCGAIVDARLVRVDGEIIKSDTWYVLRNGKIVEAE
jgi:hypothetical protein